jgi:hypothetical protein
VLLRLGPTERQSRVTVFFRMILVIPQVFVLFFVLIAAYVVAVIGWFAALFTGRLPDWAAEFITGAIRWNTRVLAYEYLLTGKYPPFSLDADADYPVDVATRPGTLNRLAVFFRLIIGIPAGIVAGLLLFGMQVFGIVTWIATLIRGSQPPLFYEANAAVIRYAARYYGFMGMVTSTYPAEVRGDGTAAAVGAGTASAPSTPGDQDALGAPPAADAQPWSLRLTSGARRLVVVFIVLGALFYGGLAAIVVAASASQQSAIEAQNQMVTAYNKLGTQAGNFASAADNCRHQLTPTGALDCQKRADAAFQQQVETYAESLDGIDFPSAVSGQAQAARNAANEAVHVLNQLQSASNSQEYLRLVTTLGLTAKLGAIDSTARALNTALLQQ